MKMKSQCYYMIKKNLYYYKNNNITESIREWYETEASKRRHKCYVETIRITL